MIDAQKLLDQFLGTGHGRPGTQGGYGSPTRPSSGNALQDGLGKIVGQVLGGSSGRAPGSSGGGLGDLVGSVLGGSRGGGSGGLGGGFAGKAIGGALAGGLASQILRGRGTKNLGGSALKLGGLALVAGLGYKAWTNYQAQQQAAAGGHLADPARGGVLPRPIAADEIPSAAGTPFHPAEHEAEDRARLLLSAMIAAAKADGHIDQAEQERIFGKIDDLDLDPEEKGLLMDEMRRPLSIDDIVARVPGREAGVEVYTASVLAIDSDHPAERAYLDMLAARLDLPAELVAEIRRTADEAKTG